MGRTKKELGLDSMGIQKSMRLTDYLGDGIGQLPLNIMSSLVGQLTYLYRKGRPCSRNGCHHASDRKDL